MWMNPQHRRKWRAPPKRPAPTYRVPTGLPAGVKDFKHLISYHSRTGEVASEGTYVWFTDGSTRDVETYKRDMYDVGVMGMEYLMKNYGYDRETAKRSAFMGQFVDYPPPAWAYWGPPRARYLDDLLKICGVPPENLELGHD